MNDVTIAIITGSIAMLSWGFADAFAKKAIDRVGPFVAQIYNLIFVVIFTVPFMFLYTDLPSFDLEKLLLFLIIGFGDFFGFLLMYKAYQIGKVSVIVPITSSYAVLSALVSYFFFKEPYSVVKAFSILIIMIGIILTAVDLRELMKGTEISKLTKGIPYAMIVFCIYGLYVPFWDKLIDGDGWLILTQYNRLYTLMIAMFAFRVFGKQLGATERLNLKIDPKNFLILLVAGFMYAIGMNAFNYGLNSTDETSIVAAVASAFPLSLAVTAYFLLKERIALNQYLGIGVIVGGIVFVSLAG